MEEADNQVMNIEDIVLKLDDSSARFIDQYNMAVIVREKEQDFLYSFDRKRFQYNYVCRCTNGR